MRTPSKHSSWSRHLEDVLKTSFVFVFRRRLEDVFRRRLQDVFKTFWLRPIYSSWPYAFKDVFKTFWRRICKTSWKTKNCDAEDLLKTSPRHVLKTSSRRLEDQKNVCWAVSLSLGWVAMIQGFFNTCQWFFHFQYHQHSGQSKKISKLLFHLIMTFTEIFEFGKVKLSKSISSKDGVWREFLEIDSNTVRFQKMSTSKREFFYHFFQSVIITWLLQNKFTFHWYF